MRDILRHISHGAAGRPLPRAYRILPYEVPFGIPGFASFDAPYHRALAVTPRSCAAWFDGFVDRLVDAHGRRYVPVARMSDGEFLFALGDQPPDKRRPLLGRATARALHLGRKLWRRGGFVAGATGRYQSGTYSRAEWSALRDKFAADMRFVAQHGVLGLHLTYGERHFQEHYFPALARWMSAHDIRLDTRNYVPKYFVYAALTGPRREEILRGRVLVINSAAGEKRERIVAGLERAGVDDVQWLTISRERSMLDHVDVTPFVGTVDLALVGAGVGKANIVRQLQPLQVPCIDAGFVFEVWANPERASERAYCQPD